ncbi:MAG: hypothetical protein ABI177_09980 [Edaphobacter sp.]
MHARLAGLKRLMSLYGDIEEMHSSELQRAMMAVQEAEQAIGAEEERARSSSSRGRDALLAGDPLGFAAARTQREIAEWKQERLQDLRLEREMLKDEVRKQYLASRMQSEQMRYVVENAAAHAEIEAGRKTQAALDDRFLARRRWSDARDQLLITTEISSS